MGSSTRLNADSSDSIIGGLLESQIALLNDHAADRIDWALVRHDVGVWLAENSKDNFSLQLSVDRKESARSPSCDAPSSSMRGVVIPSFEKGHLRERPDGGGLDQLTTEHLRQRHAHDLSCFRKVYRI